MMETLQIGRVPIHIHEDGNHTVASSWRGNESWVPYELTAFPQVGYAVSISELPRLLRSPFAMIMQRSRHWRHFSFEGTLRQIYDFMRSDEGCATTTPWVPHGSPRIMRSGRWGESQAAAVTSSAATSPGTDEQPPAQNPFVATAAEACFGSRCCPVVTPLGPLA